MSNKNSLKDKIKKPNPTQAFFNSYDDKENDSKEENKDVNDNIEINKDETYVNNNDNVKNEDDDYLRSLAAGKKANRKKTKKVFTSFYMDPDLATEVDKIAARGQKGDKSKLINQAIRKLLEEYEVL
ncbi:CopG family ribbon-helix-helix protein [Rossellomorea vietnamensis]|uniref:CopG family ribbon-helix-helix protein n=1 Tax=Rossellomorea vietnamensis TaxID=218284 RepID=UPI00077CA059|nr:ribbon-helix-helix domain-containing protein [Rossellomorea vietnamensis]